MPAMKNKHPLISVVLPIYNGEKFLLETLESISSQTFPDWELIAINDGSNDGSQKILDEYASIESRMLIVSRENRGLVETLNEGIKLAKGEWIARMDADDICLPDRFSRQLSWLQDNKAVICGGGIKRIGEGSGGNSWEFPTSTEGIYAWLMFRSAFAHPTVFIKREIAAKMPYSKEFTYSEDYELWTRMALNKESMTNLPENVLLYRIHEQQVSQKKRDIQTDVRVEITRQYWQNSSYSKDLEFLPCLVDEREKISKGAFISAIESLRQLESRFSDVQALNAINHHRVWFIYRSINLGFSTLKPILRQLNLSKSKKVAVALLAIFKADWLITYLRGANWIRYFPLKWFFR